MKLKFMPIFSSVFIMLNLCACQNNNSTNNAENKNESTKQTLVNHMTEKEKNSISVGELTLLEKSNNWKTPSSDNIEDNDSNIFTDYLMYPEEFDAIYNMIYGYNEVFELGLDEQYFENLILDFENKDSNAWQDELFTFSYPSPYEREDFKEKIQESIYIDSGRTPYTTFEEKEHTSECFEDNELFYQLLDQNKVDFNLSELDIIASILGENYTGLSIDVLELCICNASEVENQDRHWQYVNSHFEGRLTSEEDTALANVLDEWSEKISNDFKEFGVKSNVIMSVSLSRSPKIDDSNKWYFWEFDYDEVNTIKDNIQEITFYDEEMNFTFVVHVTLPPNYDKNKTYPMFVLTDGVWRFGNHTDLRKVMENGQSEDVILVSIGYDFKIDGADNNNRFMVYYENTEEFLNFITDNLSPYLGELYNIDFSRSTLYGHSAGAVFTHYAAFNSDKYDNQPFQSYIVGSPAFWSPKYFKHEKYTSDYDTEYGYFDRNKQFNKQIYMTAGDNEDPVYEDYYGENETTLEGCESFMKRMEEHNVTTVVYELFADGGHWEYIPEMLEKYMVEYYGK